jgi:hypothetical protein
VLLWSSASAACSDGIGMPIERAAEASRLDGGADAGDAARPRGEPPTRAPCHEVEDWPDDVAASELELIDRINIRRADAVPCTDRDSPAPLPLLQFAPELRCSARLHTRDRLRNPNIGLGTRGSDDSSPGTRMIAAGFELEDSGESNVQEEFSAREAMQDLLRNEPPRGPEDCLNIRDRDYTHIGVGRWDGLWTVDYAQATRSDTRDGT